MVRVDEYWLLLVLSLNQCVTASWGAALIGIICGVAASGFGMYRWAIRIGSGYVALIVSGMVAASIYASRQPPSFKATTNEAMGVVEIAILAYWFFSLPTKDDAEAMTLDQERELSERLAELSRRDPSFI